MFLSSPADIVIAGGAAGGGKTWALLVEPLRHVENGNVGAVCFRRTYPQITQEGGLWDEAADIYPLLDGVPNQNDLSYSFPSGLTVQFAHMQHAKDRLSWKGAQIPVILFDQLEDFEESQFWYLLTRNRSARAGIAPYVRATCNPVPDDDPVGGWLNKLIAWWISPDTGYAIPERAGVVRWFVRLSEKLHWADSPEELQAKFPDQDVRPKSLTFIPATLDDNPILDAADPDYRAWLMAQPLVDRERLLHGNWKVRPEAGKVFNRAQFGVPLAAEPARSEVIGAVRYFDKAGTAGAGKFTAGVLMLRLRSGLFLVADVVRDQWGASERETTIKQTAMADRQKYGDKARIWVEQEPGSGGKESAENTILNLAGFSVRAERVTGDKLTRATPLASQVQVGNVRVLQREWTEEYLAEMHRFDGVTGVMDQVDASSGAFNKLVLDAPVVFDSSRFGRL